MNRAVKIIRFEPRPSTPDLEPANDRLPIVPDKASDNDNGTHLAKVLQMTDFDGTDDGLGDRDRESEPGLETRPVSEIAPEGSHLKLLVELLAQYRAGQLKDRHGLSKILTVQADMSRELLKDVQDSTKAKQIKVALESSFLAAELEAVAGKEAVAEILAPFLIYYRAKLRMQLRKK